MIAASMAIAVGAADGATAQTYPERVVQIIVPTTAGSSADILGRVLADGMSAQLGKPFIVVDKAGANGVLGSADVARAKPDGYTLMHGATYSITLQPLNDKEAGYTVKSFTPICQTFKNDQVIVVPPNSPLKTARDIVEAAKASRARLMSASRASLPFRTLPWSHWRIRPRSSSTMCRSKARLRKCRRPAPARSTSPPCR